jgi:pimeloyl-ACP methyl ester carboxylesterase
MKSQAVVERWKRIGRGLALIAMALVVVIAGASGYDAYASRRALADYPPPGQFVQVGQARMHYLCQGSGEPTLVLEAGIGGGLLDWSPVMPALAQHNRVCAFDRLGQDWSDPAPQPRTFATAADELHGALETLGIRRPVMVGHSLGGALVQIYAARYDVAGVVLVEGLSSDVADAVVARLGSYRSLDLMGRLGLLRPLGTLVGANPAYPPDLRKQMIALRSRSTALLDIAAEGGVAADSASAELREAEARLHGPLLAIAAGGSDVPGLPPGAFAAALEHLVQRQPGATYVLVPGAGHYVQAEQPGAVTQAILQWLATIGDLSESGNRLQ